MTNWAPTLSFPFGRDVDTLVVCMNEDHRRAVIKDLGLKAQYETVESALCGGRYDRVVVLRWPNDEPFSPMVERRIREDFPTKLRIGGNLVIW